MEDADKDNSWANTRPSKSNSWKPLEMLEPSNTFPQFNMTVSNSWVNILLCTVPDAVALPIANASPTTTFAVNCIAIVSLTVLSGYVGRIAIHVDQTIIGLLTSFRFALYTTLHHFHFLTSSYRKATESTVLTTAPVKSSTPPNPLLPKDITLSLDGLRVFSSIIIQVATGFLLLTVSVPWALRLFMDMNATTVVVLSAIYCCYLIFQLKTHTALFDGETDRIDTGDCEDTYWGLLSTDTTFVALAASTAIHMILAEFLSNKISSFIPGIGGISAKSIGFILSLAITNFAEHATAAIVALRYRTDLTIGISIGLFIHVAHETGVRIAPAIGPKILELRNGLTRRETISRVYDETICRVYGLQTAIVIAATLRLRKLSFLRFIRSLVCNTRGRKFRYLMRRGTMQKYMHPVNNDRTTSWEDGGLSCPLQGSWFGFISMF
jgi:hypothetical protein